MSSSVRSGPGRPNMRRLPTSASRLIVLSGWSSVQEIGPARASEAGEVGAPRRGETAMGRAALHRAAHGRSAAQEIDGELLPLELVGRLPPIEVSRRLPARLGEEGEVGRYRLEARGIGRMHLHAAAAPSLPLVESGLEADGAEVHAGQTASLQRPGQARAVEVRCADPLEGARGAAALREIRALDQAAARIHARGVDGGHVRRRRDEGKSRLLPQHGAPPAEHGYHGEVATEAVRVIEIAGQLGDGHAVASGQWIETYERRVARIRHVAFELDAAQWIWSVQDDHGQPDAGGRAHGQRHRPHEGVVAGTDVLEVHHYRVEAVEGARRGLETLAVEAQHG